MKILLHMPHTKLRLPKIFYKGLLIDNNELNKYNLMMSDVGVDELFKGIKAHKIQSKYSRLYCDVEKFKDENLEIMSKYGQGVIYTHTFNQIRFREHDEKYKRKIFKYYNQYHKKLDRLVKRLLKKDDTLLIIDCHSYSDKLASQFETGPFPDICIGVEENYYDQEILDSIILKIKELGYTYEINFPYKGSIIPNIVYKGKVKGRVISIMLEINKRIYL